MMKWSILIILLVITVTGCYNGTDTAPEDNSIEDDNTVIVISNYCQDKIIPDAVSLAKVSEGKYKVIFGGSYYSIYSGKNINMTDAVWKDGTLMNATDASMPSEDKYCYIGYQEGENINNIYCPDMQYMKIYTPISDDGTIGRTERIKYDVTLVLQKEYSENMPISKIINITKHAVVDYECEKE